MCCWANRKIGNWYDQREFRTFRRPHWMFPACGTQSKIVPFVILKFVGIRSRVVLLTVVTIVIWILDTFNRQLAIAMGIRRGGGGGLANALLLLHLCHLLVCTSSNKVFHYTISYLFFYENSTGDNNGGQGRACLWRKGSPSLRSSVLLRQMPIHIWVYML